MGCGVSLLAIKILDAKAALHLSLDAALLEVKLHLYLERRRAAS